MKWILPTILLCSLLLAACDNKSETPSPPTSPPIESTPTAEEISEATEEVFDSSVSEAELLDSSQIPGGQIDLRYSGLVEGRIPPNSTIPTVELISMPDSTPPNYFLSISSGRIIEEIGGIQMEFRADLEPGTYPISSGLLTDEGNKPVIARIMGRNGSIYDRFMSGYFRLDSIGDTISASYVFSGANFENQFIKVTGAFNSLTPTAAQN